MGMLICPFTGKDCITDCALWVGKCAITEIADKLETHKIVNIKLPDTKAETAELIKFLNVKIRTRNALLRHYTYVRELFDNQGNLKEKELLKLRTFGKICLEDLKRSLQEIYNSKKGG